MDSGVNLVKIKVILVGVKRLIAQLKNYLNGRLQNKKKHLNAFLDISGNVREAREYRC